MLIQPAENYNDLLFYLIQNIHPLLPLLAHGTKKAYKIRGN